MAQPVIQHSFSTGEWAPNLNARVDLAKYHTGTALMRNFYVDYRGGASTRPGTKYVIQVNNTDHPNRLIPFAASSTTQYVLEFGQNVLRFHFQGAPVLETAKTITGATKANPCVITSVAHGYEQGNWIYITGVVGMTQLNNKYYRILFIDADHYSLQGLINFPNINSTSFTTYSSGGTSQRIYTLPTPYAGTDLALLKFVQSVNTMIITHASYATRILTLLSAASWTLGSVSYGSTAAIPGGTGIATTSGGAWNVSYLVTSVDQDGQESGPSSIQSTTVNAAGNVTTTLSWSAAAGAISYNVYRTTGNVSGVPPAGSSFGFIGFTTSLSFVDSWIAGVPTIAADYSASPPVVENPFAGGPVNFITVTAPGTGYTTLPTVTIAAPSSGTTATAVATMKVVSVVMTTGGSQFGPGNILTDGITGTSIRVDSTDGAGTILTYTVLNFGTYSTPGTLPTNFTFDHPPAAAANWTLTWGLGSIIMTNMGTGYTVASPPAVTISDAHGGAGTANVASLSVGNPSVPAFYQQRLTLAAPTAAPQTFFMSQPGSPFNFNISNPSQADDAITGSIVSTTLNTIKSMVQMPNGLIILSDRQAWIVNGGSAGAAITPIDAQAQAQAYNGASDVPPIVVNYDILYVQAKGSIVRDLTYNFYTNIYTGTDVTVLSSHLFFGYSIKEWAYAEEPFKVVWAVRNEGTLLSLTFVKEQELIGWAHHDTNGTFQSVCSVVETITTPAGYSVLVDAVYVIVTRTINGTAVQYIERMAERFFNSQVKNAWCVDAALQYNSTPATVFSGLDHLIGATVTGLADGVVIPSTVVSASGSVTLGTAASLVTIGLAYTPQLQTLRLDTGEPTIQGKRKSIPAVTVRVQDTLGLSIGRTTLGAFATALVPMKDLVVGNVGTMSNQVVTDLVTDDARTIIDPLWDVPGEYCIQQSNPFPATILGVIPEITVGDTK